MKRLSGGAWPGRQTQKTGESEPTQKTKDRRRKGRRYSGFKTGFKPGFETQKGRQKGRRKGKGQNGDAI
jgi:hypothetical protein